MAVNILSESLYIITKCFIKNATYIIIYYSSYLMHTSGGYKGGR